MLKFNNSEELPKLTDVFQLDDGTLFYRKRSVPERLYVNYKRHTVDANLPAQEISCEGSHGNALYFEREKKIYKAVFSPLNGITVNFLRDQLNNEQLYPRALCSRLVDGKNYVYRMCDDPEKDAILVDAPEHELSGLFKGIHRGKVILHKYTGALKEIYKLKDNVIMIECKNMILHCRESNSSVYFSCWLEGFFALDTEKLISRPSTNNNRMMSSIFMSDIVSVLNGILTVIYREGSSEYLASAQLPAEYYDKRTPIFKEIATKPKDLSNISVLAVKDVTAGNSSYSMTNTSPQKAQTTIDTSVATDSFDTLSDQCCCSICSETFDSEQFIPHVLDCGHTFCGMCVYDKLRVNNAVKCPNCSKIIGLPDGKVLPINYTVIGMAEQLMRTRADPKVTCKECQRKFSSCSVRMCIKKGCNMFNQLICLNCALDGGHGGHTVKYDVKMAKIRDGVRDEIADLCVRMEENKIIVLEKTDRLAKMFGPLRKALDEAKIPPHVVAQLDTIASEQDANDYKEIVHGLASTLIDECVTLTRALDQALNTALGLGLFSGNDVEAEAPEE